jgi:hypothetical protein
MFIIKGNTEQIPIKVYSSSLGGRRQGLLSARTNSLSLFICVGVSIWNPGFLEFTVLLPQDSVVAWATTFSYYNFLSLCACGGRGGLWHCWGSVQTQGLTYARQFALLLSYSPIILFLDSRTESKYNIFII